MKAKTASRSTVARERASLQDVRRVVVKVGTHSIATKTGRPDYRALRRLVSQLCELRKAGLEVIFVSSGAVAAGVEALGLKSRPTQVNDVQMCAAVGQARFISEYENLFGAAGVKIGQVLLTHADFDDRRRAANLRRSLDHLVRAGIVPVINENDTVSTEEIAVGDNDTLSALVAVSVKADLLIILSDIDGLFTEDPRKNPNAKLIRDITYQETIERGLKVMDTSAFQLCLDQRIPVIRIFNMDDLDNVLRVAKGEDIGTVVHL